MTSKKSHEEKEQLSLFARGQRKLYYSRIFNAFNLVEWSKNRETIFLCQFNKKNNIRYLNIGSMDMLLKTLGIQTGKEKQSNEKPKDPFRFFNENKNYNLYCSLGKIDWANCPIKVFSYALKERMEQQKVMKDNLIEYMTDWTMAIDFDGDAEFEDDKTYHLKISQEEAVNRALEELKVVKNLFEEYKIKYTIQFSGTRGFHVFFECPLDLTAKQKCDLNNLINKSLWETLDLKTLDRARFNYRKIFKLPYSLVTKENMTRVVLPLTEEKINNFKLQDTELSEVMKLRLKNRGMFWRNSEIPYKEAGQNFMKFLEDFEINYQEVLK